ncbi:MAG: hypothetical protein M1593_04255 [Candidatus Thermoplasmatota archaeon]|nr:hypothetical protein [Candidatus Thermoplasmatota archaeon]
MKMNRFLMSGIILSAALSLALYELQFTYHDLVDSLLYNIYFQGFVLNTGAWAFAIASGLHARVFDRKHNKEEP